MPRAESLRGYCRVVHLHADMLDPVLQPLKAVFRVADAGVELLAHIGVRGRVGDLGGLLGIARAEGDVQRIGDTYPVDVEIVDESAHRQSGAHELGRRRSVDRGRRRGFAEP